MLYYVQMKGRKTLETRKGKTMTLNEMITTYNAFSAADAYIFGFIVNHLLYYIRFDGHLPTELLKFDRASSKKGGMAKVRVKATSAVKQALIASGKAVLLGAASILDTDDKYNKGERFERVITERLTGEEWHKDSIPFTEAGDIEYGGKQIQIKLDQAELTNEKILTKILAAA